MDKTTITKRVLLILIALTVLTAAVAIPFVSLLVQFHTNQPLGTGLLRYVITISLVTLIYFAIGVVWAARNLETEDQTVVNTIIQFLYKSCYWLPIGIGNSETFMSLVWFAFLCLSHHNDLD